MHDLYGAGTATLSYGGESLTCCFVKTGEVLGKSIVNGFGS